MNQDPESQSFYSAPQGEYKSGELPNLRLGFIRKVLGIVCCQLLLTASFVYLCTGPLRQTFLDSAAGLNSLPIVIFILALVVMIISMIALFCYPSMLKRVPLNYILLFIFTSSIVYLVGFMTSLYEPRDVLLAAVLTASMTVFLTLYALTTKTDFTTWGATLWILGWVVLAPTCCYFWLDIRAFKPLYLAITILAIILYAFYLIYDVQLLVGGGRYELGLDDYILGAVAIYIDILGLFVRILELISLLKRCEKLLKTVQSAHSSIYYRRD